MSREEGFAPFKSSPGGVALKLIPALEGNESPVFVDVCGCVAAVAHRNFIDNFERGSPYIMSVQCTGVCSTAGDVQYTGGYHEYSGGT